jgi:uncharacterized protein
MSDSTMILYHAHCPDGFCAAWVAATSLGRGPDVVSVPVQYGDPYPPEIGGGIGRLFILDFSFPRETMRELAGFAREVVCLDHHKTAREALEGLDGSMPGLRVTFDMSRSGAMLAWDYFHPGDPPPVLVRYVMDRDLWTWGLPDSREFSAALAVEPRDFDRWSRLAGDLDDSAILREFLGRGSAILAAQSAHVESLAAAAFLGDVGGHRVPVVNSPVFQSEVGERLCQLHPAAPFSATFFVRDAGVEIWSLRSRNGFDVSAVARDLGGGGHAAAAGFRKPRIAEHGR